jgi:hypothetical protein
MRKGGGDQTYIETVRLLDLLQKSEMNPYETEKGKEVRKIKMTFAAVLLNFDVLPCLKQKKRSCPKRYLPLSPYFQRSPSP